MHNQKGDCDMVFTDGSSKIAYQQLTGGYGVWYVRGTSATDRLYWHRMRIKLIIGGNYEQLFMLCHDSRRGNPSTW